MLHIILAFLLILIAFKWGDWRNWRSYYTTIAFWIIGNYLYDTLTYNKPLWLYYSPTLSHTLLDLFWKFIIYPCVTIVFLYKFPSSRRLEQTGYLLLWIIFLASIESLISWLGYFRYYNGWNIWWSIAFDCIMFPLLKLHYEKPPLAWLASIVIGLSFIFIFKLPIFELR